MTAAVEKGITNRGPKKRDPTCLQLAHAILIPAGTILRQEPGKEGTFSCPTAKGAFTVTRANAETLPETYKKVVA